MTIKSLGPAVLVALAVAACTDGTGLGDPAPISATLQLSGSPTASPSFQVVDARSAGAVVGLADVDSLNARVTRVEALPLAFEPDSMDGGAWQSVDVSGNGLINLVKLPTETQGALVVAADSIPSGEYVNLRFFMEDLTIWFNKQIQVGQIVFQPNTPYTVTLPSGAQSGLKTRARFTLPEGGAQVSIVFDGGATLANLSITGTGAVVLAPVLTQR
jgi:hypothetical protein